jgi:hypothetical protein
MQGSSIKSDIENAIKSTSTPEMMKLVVLSACAAIVQAIALIGWYTLELDAGVVSVRFLSLDPPITSIVFFAALFCIPSVFATPLSMFTHWKPDAVLFGSKQLTDSLRGQFAAPFRMKYLYGVQAAINGVCLVSLKYDFYWPAALNIVNIVLYSAGLVLVIQHFKNPNVPTDLATTASSVMGTSTDVGRLAALEQDVKNLKEEIQELKKVAKQAPTENEA